MSDGSMEYEYTSVMPPHGSSSSSSSSGPPGSRPSRCPYAVPGRRFMDLPATSTPSWQLSPMQFQRWTPHHGPRPDLFHSMHSLDPVGLPPSAPYSNFGVASSASAPPPRPQTINPSPSSGTAAAAAPSSSALTVDSRQEDLRTPATRAHGPAANASLGLPLGGAVSSASAPTSGPGVGSSSPWSNLAQHEGPSPENTNTASSHATSARLPVPSGHSHTARPPRPRLSSGRGSTLSDEFRRETLRTTMDASNPSTPSSDDDSESELYPRMRFMGYQHSARQSQILRGQMTNKRVASKKAIQSLLPVEMATLSESEKTCVICYNDFGVASPEGIVETPLRLPKCKHVFGNRCIRKWLEESYSCPYCRDQLESELAKPSEAALRRMLAAAGESEMILAHTTSLRRMMQNFVRGDRDYRDATARRRGDYYHPDPTSSNNRDGATRGERRALPEDHTDAQRRQRPRHDALHSSRPSIASPEAPSFLTGNRHGSQTTTSQSQSPAVEPFRFASWQLGQQADSSRQSLPPQLPQPSRYSYTASRSSQVQPPMSAPLSLPHLHMMGLSYPHSATGPYNSNPLPPVASREGGYPQSTFQQPTSPSPSPHVYGFPSGFMNSLHPPLAAQDLRYPTFSPFSPMADPPTHLTYPETHHGNSYNSASQPPSSVTQPDRNGEGQSHVTFPQPS